MAQGKRNCIAGMSALQKNVDMNHAPEQGLEEDNKQQACRKDVWGWPASISHKTPGCLQGATFAGDTRPLAVSVSHIQANDHLVQVMWLKAKQNCIAGTEATNTCRNESCAKAGVGGRQQAPSLQIYLRKARGHVTSRLG